MTLEQIRLALDWTPNTNHTGFYVAQHKGWFTEAGLEIHIQPPSDQYTKEETPARKVVNGLADCCIGPTESVISCWTTEETKARLVAVAAILNEDASALTVKSSSKFSSLKSLDEAKYASYGGRFEMAIVRQAIKNDGGQGIVTEVNPPKLDCFDCVMRGETDSTWIFTAWEGLIAKKQGIELRNFPLNEAGVPYGYSPVILAHPDFLSGQKRDIMERFVKVVERGFVFAANNPAEAAKILMKEANDKRLNEMGEDFVVESQKMLSKHYLDANGKWGIMEAKRWESFVDWLCQNGCLTFRDESPVPRSSLDCVKLFTNELLK